MSNGMAGIREHQGIVGSVRDECERVAAVARNVRVEPELIALYAASLPDPAPLAAPRPDPDTRAALAAYWLTLDAINFGSGWFPTLRKRPGRTGYHTISDGLRREFDRRGPWPAAELRAIGAGELARVLRQDPDHDLIALFATSLRDLGAHVEDEYDGSFLAAVEAAGPSALAFVDTLARWECFADGSLYRGDTVPFLKRAQIAAADLHRAGVAQFDDLDGLTMFADNLVPHVLRLDGILTFDEALVARIDAETLIEHGSPEEVEIRACAVHAVELIVAACPYPTNAAQVDQLLWHRGQGRAYKAAPRHRSRCTAY